MNPFFYLLGVVFAQNIIAKIVGPNRQQLILHHAKINKIVAQINMQAAAQVAWTTDTPGINSAGRFTEFNIE